MAKEILKLIVNGRVHKVETDPEEPMLWVLRDMLKLMGTKFGCGTGICGACTVLIDNEARRSCIIPVRAVSSGVMIVTIDGSVAGMEYFGDQMCFSRDWKSILGNSYVPDAGLDYDGNMTPDSVQTSIHRFRDELLSQRRNSEVVRHNGEIVYACAV